MQHSVQKILDLGQFALHMTFTHLILGQFVLSRTFTHLILNIKVNINVKKAKKVIFGFRKKKNDMLKLEIYNKSVETTGVL